MMTLTYSPLIAHATSPKCAILWGYLNERESTTERTQLKMTDLNFDTTLSLFEIKSAFSILQKFKAIQGLEIKNGMVSYDSVDLKGLLEHLKKSKSEMLGEKSLPYLLLESVTLEKTHILMMSKMGLMLNASILFSIMNNYVHRQALSKPNQPFSHWFEANYQLWIEMSGLTMKQIKEAKRGLVEMGILESTCSGRPVVHQHRLNYQQFAHFIELYFRGLDQHNYELDEAEAI